MEVEGQRKEGRLNVKGRNGGCMSIEEQAEEKALKHEGWIR